MSDPVVFKIKILGFTAQVVMTKYKYSYIYSIKVPSLDVYSDGYHYDFNEAVDYVISEIPSAIQELVDKGLPVPEVS